jgi:hypothetical protein
MQYNIGDIFIDSGVQQRTFLITDVFVDGLEPINYYELHITPDGKHDVLSHGWLKMYIDKGYFIHYPVVK